MGCHNFFQMEKSINMFQYSSNCPFTHYEEPDFKPVVFRFLKLDNFCDCPTLCFAYFPCNIIFIYFDFFFFLNSGDTPDFNP